MAPKKNTRAPPPAPTRRSARLASRSPSVEVEGDTVSKQAGAMAPVHKTPEQPKRAMMRENGVEFTPLLTFAKRKALLESALREENESMPIPVSSSSSSTKPMPAALKRELKMTEIRRRYDGTISKQATTAPPAPPSPPSPPREVDASPKENSAVAAAPIDPTPPPQTSAEKEQPRAGWRLLSTITGYLTSPFTRKRPAEDPVEPPPSPKRTRVTSHDIVVHSLEQSPQDAEEEAQRTPRPILAPKSPRDYTGPSAKNPKVPTSLSTITEYTEPSLLSTFSESVLEGTPSKPPREQLRSSHLQAPQSTPMPQSTPTQSTSMPQSTPVRRPLGTPTMRRSAQLRAARAAGSTPISTGFAMRTTTPKPRENNADARLAKLERVRTLKRELEELQQDEDIKEMQSHRVKRVKIDNLVEIPHNRPGDPSGCFRVPEEDSDDEMEVYENVEERSNLFEEMNTETGDVSMQEDPDMVAPDTTMTFNFPDVGPIPDDYYVSEEFKAEAGRLFAEGFAEFLAT